MKVTLYTVPGTGTRFMVDMLESVFGYHVMAYKDFQFSQAADAYIRIHAEPTEQQHRLIDGIVGGAFVVPLRDPVLSYLSRYTMSKKEPGPTWTVSDSAVRWARVMGVAEKREIFYFPIEAGDLSKRIKTIIALEEKIKPKATDKELLVDLVRDWHPVGASPMSPEKEEYLETGEIKGMDLTPLDRAREWVSGLLSDDVEIVGHLAEALNSIRNPHPCSFCGKPYGPKVAVIEGKIHDYGDRHCSCLGGSVSGSAPATSKEDR